MVTLYTFVKIRFTSEIKIRTQTQNLENLVQIIVFVTGAAGKNCMKTKIQIKEPLIRTGELREADIHTLTLTRMDSN